jgi:protein involved in polysaccharide export with SLBB domain
MKRRIILFLFMIFFGITAAMAQNISTTNVQNLSDSQIAAIVQKVQSSGLSMSQAISLAKAKGATQTQISQLMSRIQQQNPGPEGTTVSSSPTGGSVTPVVYSVKAPVKAGSVARNVFGYQLFNNNKLSFDPSVNLPTPKNYVLGVGDQLFINVWGASQQTYETPVDKTGAIYIPSLGPVFVAGMNFDAASRKIKKRLAEIYSGLTKAKPDTWAMVSLSALRAIKVNIIGAANAPGTYNLPATATVFNALYLSGGPNGNGSFRNIKLIRNNKVIKTIDVYDFLITGNTSGNAQLRDQDVIFIPTYKERVRTSGNFKRDMYFELKKGETLKDLIRYAGGFTDAAYKATVSVNRLTDKQKEIVDVNEKNYATFPMKNGDMVSAGAILNRYTNRVIINGAVYRPGTYELTPGMTLADLITKADGVKQDVYSNRGLIIREKKDLTKESIPFDVNTVLQHKTTIKLQREDVVIINTIFSMREARYVRISGEIQKAGRYPYYNNMTIKDLIFLAQGFKVGASGSYVEIARRNSQQEASEPNSKLATVFTLKIDKSLKIEGGKDNFVLKPYDYVFIRRAPSYFPQKDVTINGEVNYPGTYTITTKSERISDLLKRAGGLTKFAYAPGATLKRAKMTTRIQKEKLMALTASDTAMRINAQQLATVNQSRTLVELNLQEILKHPGGPQDYVLKQGDVIYIPPIRQTVRVIGAVLNPMSLRYEKSHSLKYYVNKSGGYARNAKKSKVYILYANGTTVTKNGAIQPGSQIVVPQKPKKPYRNNVATYLSIATVFASLSVSMVAIFRK